MGNDVVLHPLVIYYLPVVLLYYSIGSVADPGYLEGDAESESCSLPFPPPHQCFIQSPKH